MAIAKNKTATTKKQPKRGIIASRKKGLSKRQRWVISGVAVVALTVIGYLGVSYFMDYMTNAALLCSPDNKPVACPKVNAPIATWNVLHDKDSVHLTEVRAGIQQLMGTADVVALQEVSGGVALNNIIKDLRAQDDIAGYSRSLSEAGNGDTLPILWNQTKLARVKQGSFKIYDNKYGTYVQLKYRDTGKTFYVFNVHPYPGVQDRLTGETACNVNKSGSACQEYSSFMNKLISVLKNYKSSTIPMFVLGDLNVDDRSDSNPADSTKRCTVSWWPCASLGKVGLVSNYTQAPVADTMRTLSYGNTYDNANTSRIVDYVFVPNSSRVSVLSTTVLNGESRDALWNGSDHNPVIATVEF